MFTSTSHQPCSQALPPCKDRERVSELGYLPHTIQLLSAMFYREYRRTQGVSTTDLVGRYVWLILHVSCVSCIHILPPPSLSPSLPPYLLPDLPLLFQNAADDQGTPGSQALRRTGECELRDLAVSSVNIYWNFSTNCEYLPKMHLNHRIMILNIMLSSS